MARTVIGKVKGDPGFSPTVNLNKEGDLLTISVINETGTQSESIKTGEPVQSNWDTVDTTSLSYIKNKPDLGKVATTNSYADLDDIPTKLSQFSNDKQFITIDAVPTTLSSFTEDANHRTVTDAEKNEWSGKQNALSSAQLDAVNSGITKVKVDAIPSSYAPVNAQENVIETVKVNGATLTPSSKAVDITVPTGAAADKGVDASIANGSSSTNLPTSKAVAAFVEGKGYKTTDTTYNVVTIEEAGLCPILPSSTTKYLRGDGTWAVPGGSNSSAIVYNNNEPTELIDGMTWVGTAT